MSTIHEDDDVQSVAVNTPSPVAGPAVIHDPGSVAVTSPSVRIVPSVASLAARSVANAVPRLARAGSSAQPTSSDGLAKLNALLNTQKISPVLKRKATRS